MTNAALQLILAIFAIVGAITTIKTIANAIYWVAKYKETIEAYAKLQNANKED